MTSLLLTIPMIPKGPNGRGGLFRMHWAARRKYFRDWEWLVKAAVNGNWTCGGELKSTVRIHQVRKRYLDTDNLYASVKPIMDALQKLGLIFDDSPKWCKLTVTQEMGRDTRTLIEVEQ